MGATEEVAKNIFRIPVRLPKNPLKVLNSYLVKDTERSLLIDTGFRLESCKADLLAGLAEIGVKPIVAKENQSYVIATFGLGNLDFSKLYAALKAKGFIIYPGKLTDEPTFRLGNIGDLYPSDMSNLVEAIRELSGSLS